MRSCGQIVFASLNVAVCFFDCLWLFFFRLFDSLLICFVCFLIVFVFVFVCFCLFLFVLVCSFFFVNVFFVCFLIIYSYVFACLGTELITCLFSCLQVLFDFVISHHFPLTAQTHTLTYSLTHSLTHSFFVVSSQCVCACVYVCLWLCERVCVFVFVSGLLSVQDQLWKLHQRQWQCILPSVWRCRSCFLCSLVFLCVWLYLCLCVWLCFVCVMYLLVCPCVYARVLSCGNCTSGNDKVFCQVCGDAEVTFCVHLSSCVFLCVWLCLCLRVWLCFVCVHVLVHVSLCVRVCTCVCVCVLNLRNWIWMSLLKIHENWCVFVLTWPTMKILWMC